MTTQNNCNPTGQTYVVYQKGRAYCASFYDASCYRFYTLRLLHSVNNYHVKLHAYCLLQQELFLLVTPGTPRGIDRLLASLNRSYTEYFNERFDRVGQVFTHTPQQSLIQGDRLVLDCQKFVERAALDSRVVEHPGRHHWSSYCANAFGGGSEFLAPHPALSAFLRRGPDPRRRYRDYLSAPFADGYRLYLNANLRFGKMPGKRRLPPMGRILKKRRMGSGSATGQAVPA